MNILLTNSTNIFAGGEDYVLILAKHLAARGHTVSVSALPGHLLLTKCNAAGIATVPVNYGSMSHLFQVASVLRKELRNRGVQIVHSNANYDRTCAAIAASRSSVRHVASVHSAHSIQHNLTHWLRNRWGTAHFVADADAVKQVLVREDGIDPSRITVVPIGVETDAPDVRAAARTRARAELTVGDQTVVIGNVARLVAFKGHRYLLQAAAEVVRARSDVLFLIVGDGELTDELSRQVCDLRIGHAVRFLGFRDDLNHLYPGFDVYCHSSLELAEEAFPLAILRALAAGLPVVCTAVGGIGMMVDHGKSGYLVPPEDPHALAEALTAVLSNPDRRAAMGQASFALFERTFHASAMAERVERIYQSLLRT